MAGDEVTGLQDSCQCLLSCAGLILCTLFIFSIVRLLFIKWRQNRTTNGYSRLPKKYSDQEYLMDERKEYAKTKRLCDDLNEELENTRKLYEKEQADHDATRQRLSELMSNRLTDNNPNIANLSDEKRPTKLVEEFSELYDNAWTDAFESIKGHEERSSTGFLLSILEIAFTYCKTQAEDQFWQLELLLSRRSKVSKTTKKGSESTACSKDLIKAFKDERKRMGPFSAKHVEEGLLKKIKDDFNESQWTGEFTKETIENYCRQCGNLCWLLVIQDLPMDVQFNANKTVDYKPYTKSGKRLDFVVWPPLYLHKGGNLMAKGVAQFC